MENDLQGIAKLASRTMVAANRGDGTCYRIHTKYVAEGNRIVLRKAFSNLMDSEYRLLSYNYNSGVAVAEKIAPWA